ncbi:MAG: hypothetical protein R3B93_07430 [Bacteroidia bacterium]
MQFLFRNKLSPYYWLDYLQPPEKSILYILTCLDELLDLEPSSMCGYGQEEIYRDALVKEMEYII